MIIWKTDDKVIKGNRKGRQYMLNNFRRLWSFQKRTMILNIILTIIVFFMYQTHSNSIETIQHSANVARNIVNQQESLQTQQFVTQPNEVVVKNVVTGEKEKVESSSKGNISFFYFSFGLLFLSFYFFL